jgi:hypothetical protein
MTVRRPTVRRLLAIGVSTVALLGGGLSALPAAEAGVNTAADHLVVYNDNVENLVTKKAGCDEAYDFNKLIAYMKKQPQSPDVFTVQQISGIDQMNALTKRLSDALPGTYGGVIAYTHPGQMGYTGKCTKRKNFQTNAVIYRVGRLSIEQTARWRSDAPSGGDCKNLHGKGKDTQDRVQNVAVRFKDLKSGNRVSVASIHWPTNTWKGPKCAAENFKEANAAVDQLGGTLRIIAGDANATTDAANWWAKARKEGFRDPMAEKCGGEKCSSAYNTNGKRRIDFLLAESGHGFSHVDTVRAGNYSGHKALTAWVKY